MRRSDGQQTIENLKGEIKFRALLYKQHVEGQRIFDDEHSKEEIYKILVEGCSKSERQFKELKKRNLLKQPYLEIGAEKCHRGLVANNRFGLTGVATDISYHSLKAADYLATRMGLDDIPLRICCDVNNMPFQDNSFPLIFCYATIHHFSDPSPILKEVERVLARGGCFFFDEEPVRRRLKLHLYKRRDKIYSSEAQKKSKCLRALGALVSDASCNEEEFGIIENQDTTISQWERALAIFDKVEIIVSRDFPLFSEFKYQSDIDGKVKGMLKRTWFSLVGGGISALCFKNPREKVRESRLSEDNLLSFLRCPECAQKNLNSNLQCNKNITVLRCDNCGTKFPKKEGIFFLFSEELFEELYSKLI